MSHCTTIQTQIRDEMAEAKMPVRILVVLDGGLVQHVLVDRPGVEAAVLDQDIDGMFAAQAGTSTSQPIRQSGEA